MREQRKVHSIILPLSVKSFSAVDVEMKLNILLISMVIIEKKFSIDIFFNYIQYTYSLKITFTKSYIYKKFIKYII